MTVSDSSHYMGNANGITYSMDIDDKSGEISEITADGLKVVFE